MITSGIQTVGDSSWLIEERFGLFIHWGIYALPARHEWVQQLEEIYPADYQRYFDHFDPDLYNPEVWAQAAADAGMKFVCPTAKHHDGFCLWGSQYTDFKVTNTTYGKDVLKPMVEAFRKCDMRIGLYYSLIDWHHPHFVIDSLHALRNHPQRKELNKKRDQKKYIEYLHNQVRELLTNFGSIDMCFFDFSYPEKIAYPPNMEDNWQGKDRSDWDSEKLIKLVRQLQPQTIVNERLDLDDIDGGWDFRSPEQFQPRQWVEFKGQRVNWVAVHTLSGSWGYHRDEATWKSPAQLIEILISTVSKGGNLLLNIGPTGRGTFDQRALNSLSAIGKWMKLHNRSIYGCTAVSVDFPEPPSNCLYTWNPKTRRLYVHILSWPMKHLHLDGLHDKVEYAQLLNDASQIHMGLDKWYVDQGAKQCASETLTLELPIQKPNAEIPVVELFLKS
jgi:alpha-L-fucosidase